MKKDIFIDTNCAIKLNNPISINYKDLFCWLLRNEGDGNDPVLVVSHKLLVEYSRSCGDIPNNNNFPLILNLLIKNGRLHNIKKTDIENFKTNNFTNAIQRKMRSNIEDRNHIPVVLLSERKYALCEDINLTFDLLLFKKYHVLVKTNPKDIPYRD